MSGDTKKTIQDLVKEYKEFCDKRNLDPHTLTYKSDTSNLDSETPQNSQPRISPEGLDKLSEIATMLINSLDTVEGIKKSAKKKIDQDIETLEILDISKTFDQLCKPGYAPNAVEQKLIDAVDAHLSETEKKDVISSKKPVLDVIQKVEMAVIRLVQEANLMLRTEKKKEESKEKERPQPAKDDKMHSLGDAYGVTDAIAKSIRERANELSESHQRGNAPSESHKKPIFEVVDSTQISSKDMGIDKNNIAEKEKKQELKISG